MDQAFNRTIAGAANGVVRAPARNFEGQRILLESIDTNSTELQVVAELCNATGSQVVTGTIDVSDKSIINTFINFFMNSSDPSMF